MMKTLGTNNRTLPFNSGRTKRGRWFQKNLKLTTCSSSCHAVVAGGSISGLLAAKVLSKHCDSVTIVDKDDLMLPPRIEGMTFDQVSIHCLIEYTHAIKLYCPSIVADMDLAKGSPSNDTAPSTYCRRSTSS